jgi:hypothetical protein
MSPPTLREPWFLKGRRSVFVRVVLMSAALGGLGSLAGVVWLISSTIVMRTVHDGTQFALAGGAGAALFALGVGIPYGRWRGDSGRTICIRVAGTALASTLLPLIVSGTLASVAPEAQSAAERWASEDMQIAYEALLVLLALELTWCLSYLQISRRWLLMTGLSAIAVPALPYLFRGMEMAQEAVRDATRGVPEVAVAFEVISSVSFFGQFFVLFFAPWGMPFWFPPEKVLAPVDAAQG